MSLPVLLLTVVFCHIACERQLLLLGYLRAMKELLQSPVCTLQADKFSSSMSGWQKGHLTDKLAMYLYRYVTHWLTAGIHISCDRNHMSSYFRLWIHQVQVACIVICSVVSLEMEWVTEVRLWKVGNTPKGSAIHSVKHTELYSLLEACTDEINVLGLKNRVVVLILKNGLLWYCWYVVC